jgi:hypothetical protein
MSAVLPFTAMVGNYIYFTVGGNAGSVTRIVTFTESTMTATFQAVPNVIAAGDAFEILQLSYDCAQSLKYSGNIGNNNEASLYEVTCKLVTVPANVTLESGYGGNCYSYSSLMIRFQAASASNSSNAIMYSNSPVTLQSQFIMPFADSVTSSNFLKLTRSPQRVTMNIKISDLLSFEVRTQDGDVLKMPSDNFSPRAPNPLLQIFALFELVKL